MFRGLTDKDWRELRKYIDRNCCCGGGGDPSTDPNNCLIVGSDGNLYYDCSAAGSDGNGMFSASNQGGTWGVTDTVMGIGNTILRFNDTDTSLILNNESIANTSLEFKLSSSPQIILRRGNAILELKPHSNVTWNNIYESFGVGLRLGGDSPSVVHIALTGSAGQVDFPKYGLGNFGGTVAYPAAFDASGKVIEGPVNGLRNGMFSASNQGSTWAVTDCLLNTQTTFNTGTGGNIRMLGSNGWPVLNIGDTWLFSPFSNYTALQGFNASVVDFRIQDYLQNPIIKFMTSGDVELTQYGLGNFIGTPAYSLGVSASGQIVEVAGGGGNGMFDAANEGGTWGVNNITLAAGATDFKFGGSSRLEINSPVNPFNVPFSIRGNGSHIQFSCENNGNEHTKFAFYNGSTSRVIALDFYRSRGSVSAPIDFEDGPDIISYLISSRMYKDGNYQGNGDIVFSTSTNFATGNYHSKFKFVTVDSLGVKLDCLVLDGSNVHFGQYIGSAKDAAPARSLGVDAVGKVVTFVGAGPAVAGQQEIPNGDITVTDSDHMLPPITNIGNIQVVANPSGGSSVTVSPSPGNTIEGFALVGNKEGGMFISVSLTRWFRIRG